MSKYCSVLTSLNFLWFKPYQEGTNGRPLPPVKLDITRLDIVTNLVRLKSQFFFTDLEYNKHTERILKTRFHAVCYIGDWYRLKPSFLG